MLREALLGRVNEEGGSGSLLHSNSVRRAAGVEGGAKNNLMSLPQSEKV